MSKFTMWQIDRLADSALRGEGRTEFAFNAPEFSHRYIVGGVKPGFVRTMAGLNRADIIADLQALADTSPETLGVWIDDGTLYIDAGDTHYHIDGATQHATQRGERAIYDRLRHRVIDVTTD